MNSPNLKTCLLPVQLTIKNRYNAFIFWQHQKLFLLKQNAVRVSAMDLPYFCTKLYFSQNLLKFLSNSLVCRRKTLLQKPSSDQPIFAVKMFFQTQECLYVQAGLPWCCVTWGGKPHTRVKEMSSAWDTDDGKCNLPTSSRWGIERNVLIQRGRTPVQGTLDWNELLCLIRLQMGCELRASHRKPVPILCLHNGSQLPSGLIS